MNNDIFKALNLSDFVVVDIETTGLDFQLEEIIEFAAVRYHDGEVKQTLQLLVKPARPLPEFITRLTGLRDDDLSGAAPFTEHLQEIRDFIGDFPLVAHNIRFDLQFLEHHARKVHSDFEGWGRKGSTYHYFPNPQIDTVLLSRMYFPFLESHSLHAMTEYLRIEKEGAHRALPDALATGALFLQLIERALRTPFAEVQKILEILEPEDEPGKMFFESLAICLASNTVSVAEGIDPEQFRISANHYNIIGEDEVPRFFEEEVTPIDAEEIAGFFDEGGALSREFRRFEVRGPQVRMASAVAGAFNSSELLVVEAGTGTGKSLAYLLPAIRWALKNYGEQGRVIISTNTKNLQEQLFFKDLPLLHSVLKEKFKAVLLKGRANYLCLDKWVRVLKDPEHLLTERERSRILPLMFWAKETQTGDISENPGFSAERNMGLWTKLIAENNYCPGRKCKYYDQCYLMRARNNAANAHIVLVNHSLLFSDLSVDHAVLGEYANVIFDEAHNIEKTATEYLGAQLSYWQFRDMLGKLHLKERKETGILAQLRHRIRGGTLPHKHLDHLEKNIDRLINLIVDTRTSTQALFRDMTSVLAERTPGRSSQYSRRHRYIQQDRLFEPVAERYEEALNSLSLLAETLSGLIEYLRILPDEQFEYQRQIFQDLSAQQTQCGLLVHNLKMLLDADSAEYVYWFELPSRTESIDTRLYAAPLEVGPLLNNLLYGSLRSAMFTSATLAVNQEFNYFLRAVGLNLAPEERVRKILLDSPFNYPEQVFLGVPSFIEDPNDPAFSEGLARFITALHETVPQGTLALFTSYSMLNRAYEAVRENFMRRQITLLGQGIDGSRHSLIEQFRTDDSSILFGTDSFWEGVDVPGKALEMVLITRLPFDVPSEPILEARSERVKASGGNPFMELSIPEAVIRLRQGFGRLIRTRDDFGAVLILDNRVIKKLYGRIFLQSLPVEARILASPEETFTALKRWFGVTAKPQRNPELD